MLVIITYTNSKMHLVILRRTFWKGACYFQRHAPYSQGVLVLAVFVQDGVPALVGEGRLYLKDA